MGLRWMAISASLGEKICQSTFQLQSGAGAGREPLLQRAEVFGQSMINVVSHDLFSANYAASTRQGT